jgi:predicted dinucleotide-binding enzyme
MIKINENLSGTCHRRLALDRCGDRQATGGGRCRRRHYLERLTGQAAAVVNDIEEAGIRATIANSRGPEVLSALAGELQPFIKAGTIEEAASADIVLVAVPWSKLPKALADQPDWNGRILIDASNPIEARLFKPAELNGRLSTEVFADLVTGARVVKGFNHLLPALVAGDPEAEGGKRRPVLFQTMRVPRRQTGR